MSQVRVNTIVDANSGNTAQINGMTPTADSLQGFRNRIINGDMRIDQRNAGASVTNISINTYVLDRFQQFFSNCGSINVQQSADAPTGFTNSLQCEVNTTKTPAATDSIALIQRIEGYNISDLGFGTATAKPITLSFWVKSSVVGTYVLYLANSVATNASYSTTYTINTANTWEFKTIVIPGDVANTMPNLTNEQGMVVVWGLGGGPDRYPTVLNAWTTEARFMTATSTSTQWISNAGATFYITGVQLEAGSTATPFERRPFGTELMLCQRYYYKLFEEYGAGFCTAATTARFIVHFPAVMRVAPTALETSGTAADYRVLHGTSGTTCNSIPTFATASFSTFRGTAGVASGLTAGQGVIFNNGGASTSFLAWSAEL
jgi:hypothetical protein